jgi:hypothetical protein
MFENFLKLFKKKPNPEIVELKKNIQDQMNGFLVRLQALDEQSVACLQIIYDEVKARQNIAKGLKSSVDVIIRHSNEIKGLNTIVNDHADVINNNMKVLNTHLIDEHDIQLNDNPNETVHDVLKIMSKRTVKKDNGKN